MDDEQRNIDEVQEAQILLYKAIKWHETAGRKGFHKEQFENWAVRNSQENFNLQKRFGLHKKEDIGDIMFDLTKRNNKNEDIPKLKNHHNSKWLRRLDEILTFELDVSKEEQ